MEFPLIRFMEIQVQGFCPEPLKPVQFNNKKSSECLLLLIFLFIGGSLIISVEPWL